MRGSRPLGAGRGFADGARLYPHVHALVPDGVFVASSDGQSARFIRQDPPADAEVPPTELVRRLGQNQPPSDDPAALASSSRLPLRRRPSRSAATMGAVGGAHLDLPVDRIALAS